MNGPVAPPARPARPYPQRDVRDRLGGVLLAPIRALALFGLTLAGAVLLVVAFGPVLLGVLGLGHLVADVLQQGPDGGLFGNQPRRDLLAIVIGLTCCRFILPATLLGVRRLAVETRLLSARWC